MEMDFINQQGERQQSMNIKQQLSEHLCRHRLAEAAAAGHADLTPYLTPFHNFLNFSTNINSQ